MTATLTYNRRVGRKPTKGKKVYLRITDETSQLAEELKARLNITRTDAFERGIRCLADREGIVAESAAGYSPSPDPKTVGADPTDDTDPTRTSGTG